MHRPNSLAPSSDVMSGKWMENIGEIRTRDGNSNINVAHRQRHRALHKEHETMCVKARPSLASNRSGQATEVMAFRMFGGRVVAQPTIHSDARSHASFGDVRVLDLHHGDGMIVLCALLGSGFCHSALTAWTESDVACSRDRLAFHICSQTGQCSSRLDSEAQVPALAKAASQISC